MNIGMSGEQTQVMQSSSKGLRGRIRAGIIRDRLQRERPQFDQNGVKEGSADQVLDQVILIPEIMSMILEQLDLRSLKTVRLVCKSWLREAQTHLERRSTVRFYRDSCETRIEEFIQVIETQIAGQPQPFQSVQADLLSWYPYGHKLVPYDLIFYQFSTLCPPLVVTKLSPWNIPLKLVLPFLIECSASLQYLLLISDFCETGFLPVMDPNQSFPNLRHLDVEASFFQEEFGSDKNHFPSIAAWIAKASPNLETYEYGRVNRKVVSELASQMLLQVDIRNVKSLMLYSVTLRDTLTDAALKHFSSIPFIRLQSLDLQIYVGPRSSWSNAPLFATLTKSAHTLTKLDLGGFECCDDFASFNYPVFPNVRELTMSSVPFSNRFIRCFFPSLEVLNAGELDEVKGEQWGRVVALPRLKTLRIQKCSAIFSYLWDWEEDEEPVEPKFFSKFPGLERLYAHPSLVTRCSGLKSSADSKFLLDGIRHLGLCEDWIGVTTTGDYSLLAALKGVETITLTKFSEEILTLPAGELPRLKIIQFPWGDCSQLDQWDEATKKNNNFCSYMDKFLEMARCVKKIVITNCCSFPSLGVSHSNDVLNTLFASAPNVECGCEDWNKMPKWFANYADPDDTDTDSDDAASANEDEVW